MDRPVKQDIIASFATKQGDSGSPEVQVAILTADIKYLTEHLKIHKKDHSSRRGLIAKVNRRRKLLDYLKGESAERYQSLVSRLELRH